MYQSKKYALVLRKKCIVILYSTWEHSQQDGCVLETSEDKEYLERRAEEINYDREQTLELDDMWADLELNNWD